MPKLPVLKPREVVRILGNLGFKQVRQSGSHKQYKHTDGRQTTVAFHKGCDISPIMLKVIAADIGMTPEEFIRAQK